MKKLLVVEDDRLLGKELALSLGEAGYDVTWTHTIEETTAVLSKEIGLVFLDIMLTGQDDGFTILRHIKTSEELQDIPVVMLTNIAPSTDIDRAMELGAADYVIKAMTDLDRITEIAHKYLPLSS